MTKGNELDHWLFMQHDFVLNSFKFIMTHFDQIIMMTIIIFLFISWTIMFEWKVPEGEKVLIKKKIIINKNGFVEGMENFIKSPHIPKSHLQKKNKDCGEDVLCKNEEMCHYITNVLECDKKPECNKINRGKGFECVGGSKEGPTYHQVDEWWYLGKKNKN